MGNFLKSAKFRIIVCILALLVGVMIYALTMGGYTISTVGVFRSIAAPFQRASNAISSRVEYILEVYSNARENYEQNRALRSEINELQQQLADQEVLEAELERMEAYTGILEQHKEITYSAPCEVIGYLANDPFGAFMIDAGTADGLALYQPIVNAEGLIGVITEIGTDTATVTTILSPELSVAVYCSTTKDQGVLTGSVALAMEGKCRLQYLDKDTILSENKAIVTSGENGLFPKGYTVGYVQEVGMDETGLTAYAVIEPAADLAHLDMVMAITNFEGKEDGR